MNVNITFFFSYGPLFITVCAMKLLRSNFSATARQHIVLIWTVLFFEFDYRHSSETFPIDYFVMSIFVDKVQFLTTFCMSVVLCYFTFCILVDFSFLWTSNSVVLLCLSDIFYQRTDEISRF